MKILIVEDDAKKARQLRDYMQSKSAEVILAEDGYQAMNTMKDQQFDLVMSDANMPYMDGYVLAKNVKKEFRTPFFMYSSSEIPPDNKELAKRFGADLCLVNTGILEICTEALSAFAALKPSI